MSAHASPETAHQEHGDGHGHGHHEAPKEPKVYRIGIDAEDFTFTFPNPDGELAQFFSDSPDDAWYKSLAVQDPDKFKHDILPPGLAKVKERLIELGFDFDNPFAQAVPFGTERTSSDEHGDESSENGHGNKPDDVIEAELVDESVAPSTGDSPEEIVIEDENEPVGPEASENDQEKLRTTKVRDFFKKTGRGAKTVFRIVRKATAPRVAHAGAHKVGDAIDSTSSAIDTGMGNIEDAHDSVSDRMREGIEEFPFLAGLHIEHGVRETLMKADLAADTVARVIEAGIDMSNEWRSAKFRAAGDALGDGILRLMNQWLVLAEKFDQKRKIRRNAKNFRKVKRDVKKGARQYEKQLENEEINEQVLRNVVAIRAYIASKHPRKEPRYRKYEEEKASWINLP